MTTVRSTASVPMSALGTCALLLLAVPAPAGPPCTGDRLSVDPSLDTWFGRAVDVNGDVVIASAPSSGVAYVFEHDGTAWNEVAIVVGAEDESYGWSVAVDGDVAVLGVPRRDGAFSDEGAAVVLERTGGTWTPVAELEAPAPSAGDRFGWSVAVRGSLIAVGSPHDDGGADNGGAVHLYRRTGGDLAWSHVAALRPAEPCAGARFGWSVALDVDPFDAGFLVAGAPRGGDAGPEAGAMHVFIESKFVPDLWDEVVRLFPASPVLDDGFGTSVALGPSGRIVAGAPGTGERRGAAHVFDPDPLEPLSWNETAVLSGAAAETGDVASAVAAAGSRVLLGAPQHDGGGINAGACWIFERGSDGGWTEVLTLASPDPEDGEWWAGTVAASGARAVIGAHLYDPPETFMTGGAFIFDLGACLGCAEDLDGDGTIGFTDLLAVLAAWGPCPGGCPEDVDADEVVGFTDLLAVLAAWGEC